MMNVVVFVVMVTMVNAVMKAAEMAMVKTGVVATV